MWVAVHDVRQPRGIVLPGCLARCDRRLGDRGSCPQRVVKRLSKEEGRLISDGPQGADERTGAGSKERLRKAADTGQLITGAAGLACIQEDYRLRTVGRAEPAERLDDGGVEVARDELSFHAPFEDEAR